MDFEAQRFTEFIHARRTGRAPHGFNASKLFGKEVARECGVRVPITYRTFVDLDTIDLSDLPERFVLKPNYLWSRRGVHLLERRGGEFFELLQQKLMTSIEIIANLKEIFSKSNRLDVSVIAEEFVIGENGSGQIPFDYKFYVFDETVSIILQVNRNPEPKELSIFGPDFGELRDNLITFGNLFKRGEKVIPANASAMSEAAKRISKHLKTPFCGIDLYTSGSEVYFGELTPTPGTPYHGKVIRLAPEFDGELGGYWKMGCRKLGEKTPMISSTPPVAEMVAAEQARKYWEESGLKESQLKGVRELREEISRMKSSLTWRLCKPFRWMEKKMRRSGR